MDNVNELMKKAGDALYMAEPVLVGTSSKGDYRTIEIALYELDKQFQRLVAVLAVSNNVLKKELVENGKPLDLDYANVLDKYKSFQKIMMLAKKMIDEDYIYSAKEASKL